VSRMVLGRILGMNLGAFLDKIHVTNTTPNTKCE
jgi:hypothetical protein